jgi:hypothetical protein
MEPNIKKQRPLEAVGCLGVSGYQTVVQNAPTRSFHEPQNGDVRSALKQSAKPDITGSTELIRQR